MAFRPGIALAHQTVKFLVKALVLYSQEIAHKLSINDPLPVIALAFGMTLLEELYFSVYYDVFNDPTGTAFTRVESLMTQQVQLLPE